MSGEIFRRDPRAEWIARNRLHPLHQEMQPQQAEVRGPSGLIRRNPHAIGFIGPNGIKRIDRSGMSAQVSSSRRAAGAAQEVVLPLHSVEAPEQYLVVVPDMPGGRLSSHDKDVIGQAHQLIRESGVEGAVVALVFGESREEAFDTAGVDRLIHVEGEQFAGYSPEDKLAVMQQVEAELKPAHWLFPDSTMGGFELGCRLSAALGERPATQAWSVTATETIRRGASGTLDFKGETPRILLLAVECANPIDETRHEVKPISIGEVAPVAARITDNGPVAVNPNEIALGEAEFIFSAGNGVDNWDLYHDTAAALGATEGASRVAVDDGHMPRFRQVGATGTWVTARVYVAVGISGAIQHLQGIGQCEKVIAINTDLGCDMVKRAALSVIADSGEMMVELKKLAEAHQQEVSNEAA